MHRFFATKSSKRNNMETLTQHCHPFGTKRSILRNSRPALPHGGGATGFSCPGCGTFPGMHRRERSQMMRGMMRGIRRGKPRRSRHAASAPPPPRSDTDSPSVRGVADGPVGWRSSAGVNPAGRAASRPRPSPRDAPPGPSPQPTPEIPPQRHGQPLRPGCRRRAGQAAAPPPNPPSMSPRCPVHWPPPRPPQPRSAHKKGGASAPKGSNASA